jgi:hypothetical protein
MAAWIGATVAVVIAVFAPFPTPEQRFSALLLAPTALIVPLWRVARLRTGDQDAALLRLGRLDCWAAGYALAGIAVAGSVSAVAVLALGGSLAGVKAVLLAGLGGAALLAAVRYFAFRLR